MIFLLASVAERDSGLIMIMLSLNRQYLFIIVIATLCKFSIAGYKCNAKRNLNRQFDTLVFVQQWPVTYCQNWMNAGNECKLPPQNGIWTIHGIWPSRFNTNVDQQPECCDSSVDINVDELRAIKEQLKRDWPSVQKEKGDEDFWEYEWYKHGTCSVSIYDLNSSTKYFSKALDWLREYNMNTILARSNIVPDNEKSYQLLDIHTAVKRVLNKNPSINCYIDRTSNEQYLNEVRLCFNLQLELIDCDGIDRRTSKDNVSTNCLNKPINYRTDGFDHTSGWFTFFAYFGLVLFVLFIVMLIRKVDLVQRFRNGEFSHLLK